MLSRFHPIPGRYGRTDGQTDRRTKLLYQYRASIVLARDKNLLIEDTIIICNSCAYVECNTDCRFVSFIACHVHEV